MFLEHCLESNNNEPIYMVGLYFTTINTRSSSTAEGPRVHAMSVEGLQLTDYAR